MDISQQLYIQAQEYIPGGVNSPVRSCRNVGVPPLFIQKASGSHIWSEDGQELIDYVMSWGPMLLGHAHPSVLEAIQTALVKGTSFGAPCRYEIELARLITELVPGIDMVRMVNSGTEATMSALRLARAYTGRNAFLKFHGGYHGHGDPFLASAGSGVATQSIPGTPGVPDAVVSETLLAEYNDLNGVQKIFTARGQEIAAIIVEPVAGNMGLVLPRPGFLQGLRELCDQYGTLLIFDEVITGFRLSLHCAQGYFGIIPDLTCLGKIIGGGLPVGAYGGRQDIMSLVAPSGNVYQAGTLSGNPLAMAAGLATLRELQKKDYTALAEETASFAKALQAVLQKKGIAVQLNQIGSLFTLFFSNEPITNFTSAQKQRSQLFTTFYQQMREKGIYLAPSGYECAFCSFAHSQKDKEKTIAAAAAVKF